MRAIDADELLKQQYKMGFGQMPVVSVDAIKNAPTLTPPNEWVSVENALPPAEGRNMKRYSESLEQWEQEAYYDGYGADCGGRGNWRNPFCPNCGRAMTPEAWAELEKRIRGAAMPEPPEARG